MLDQWIRELAEALGIELDLDNDLVLDLAGDAARAVMRPAAPLTTFLVGYAAALQGGGEEAVQRAAATASDLAARWAQRAEATSSDEDDDEPVVDDDAAAEV
ncbi:MAG: DUF6457 domain-containing protein [Actinobacteria bacterium]|nr:DUF6457 domain-containing protein [Actinomycetota bacterium]